MKTAVIKVQRPLDEGLCEGDIKKRTRKCRQCAKNFVTFEIHEATWRQLPKEAEQLTRRPLLNEAARAEPRRPNITG